MAIFITQARLSQEAVKNMLARPEDRFAAVEKLVAAAGGKLLHYYVTTANTMCFLSARHRTEPMP